MWRITMSIDKVRENRVRRKAERQGLTLARSRRRDPDARDFGGYMLIDAQTNAVAAGGDPHAYSLTLDEAEAWLTKA
jgi:hypothetical protein